jgi:hypothetical protein
MDCASPSGKLSKELFSITKKGKKRKRISEWWHGSSDASCERGSENGGVSLALAKRAALSGLGLGVGVVLEAQRVFGACR